MKVQKDKLERERVRMNGKNGEREIEENSGSLSAFFRVREFVKAVRGGSRR